MTIKERIELVDRITLVRFHTDKGSVPTRAYVTTSKEVRAGLRLDLWRRFRFVGVLSSSMQNALENPNQEEHR